MDDKELVFLTLLDLSAAFDTVDHHILINRLRNYFGITEGAIEWIQSYLHDRTQKVIVNGRESSPQLLECCVPQGSVLGFVVLFRLYQATGSSLHSLGFQFQLYADDSQLITSIPGGTPTDQSIAINLVQNAVKQIDE